jgi:HEAT repeat protein
MFRVFVFVVTLASWCLPLVSFAQEETDVQSLIADLQSSELETKRDAAYALAALGPKAKPAVPNLIKALDDRMSRSGFNR